ncbi:MAG: restriction endonuclease [Gloeomargaritaceae cyanobacterium C42_A2020_066]|nr:restriction endonuclease [Gloeomargaritaceae cyanobacterium C42_A2020_066]
MNFLDAAYTVLKAAGRPLHYEDITYQALAQGLLGTVGQTPEATMGSRLYVDSKQENSRFKKVGKGVFALVQEASSTIHDAIELTNKETREQLYNRLKTMEPQRFEELVVQLLIAIGFDENETRVTRYTRDGGVDIRGLLRAGGVTEINAAVQVKRWKKSVQAPDIQALRGALTAHEQGIFITTSKFSSGAQEDAKKTGKVPISLIDGDLLLDLLIQHEIGVLVQRTMVYSLDKEWWDEFAGPMIEPVAADAEVPTTANNIPETISPLDFPVLITGSAHRKTLEAHLLDLNGRIRYEGRDYSSPSAAGIAASGWRTCNGWTFWKYQDATTGQWRSIQNLRVQ